MAKNYALEARIKEACRAGGALETALDDFVVDHEAYKFTEASFRHTSKNAVLRSRTALPSNQITTPSFVNRHSSAKTKPPKAGFIVPLVRSSFEELKTLYANGGPEPPRKRLTAQTRGRQTVGTRKSKRRSCAALGRRRLPSWPVRPAHSWARLAPVPSILHRSGERANRGGNPGTKHNRRGA